MEKSTIILFAMLALTGRAQQDPQYSLYQFNQLVINPAYAGSRDGLSAVAVNRQQWVGFDGAPRTTALSVHGPVMNKNLGLGLTLTSDIIGPRNVTSVYGNVAYLLKVTNTSRLSFGLNAGYNRYQFAFNKIEFKDGEAASPYVNSQTFGALDINGGLYYKAERFFVGLSATHLNNTKVFAYDDGKVEYRLGTHIFFMAGYSFDLSKEVIFAPTVLIKTTQGAMTFDINANFFLFKKLWAGVFYRNAYGPGLVLQYYVSNKLRVGLGYDTGLQSQRRLGHSFEAMLGFDFAGNKAKMVNPRFL